MGIYVLCLEEYGMRLLIHVAMYQELLNISEEQWQAGLKSAKEKAVLTAWLKTQIV
jgi:hypothetical protein